MRASWLVRSWCLALRSSWKVGSFTRRRAVRVRMARTSSPITLTIWRCLSCSSIRFTAGDLTVEPFLGGYVACGVGGKIKDFNYRTAYDSFGDKYDDNFRRFDGGVKVGCGIGFDIFYVGASYDIGLANIGKDSFQDTHTGCFNLDFGVTF